MKDTAFSHACGLWFKACKGLSLYDDQLRNTLKIKGLDLQKQIEDLNRTLKER